jgi:hypothetical protein
VAGLAAIAVVVFHRQVLHPFSVPDRGDPLFSMWRIAWVQHQLVTDPRHLFDANIFYPLRATLTYSDAMILPALAAWPLAWIGLHPVAAYNVVLLSAFVISGFAAYLLVEALGWGRHAAWIAGVAFMLSPFRMNHFSHLELQMTMWMPLALLATCGVLQTGRVKSVAGLSAALAAQWYSSMYYGLFLQLYAALFAIALMIAWKSPWRRIGCTAAGHAVAIVLILPLAVAYVQSHAARGERQVESVAEFSGTPADYLRPGVATPVYRPLLPRVVHAERALFPGVAPAVLAAAGLWPPFGAVRAGVATAGVAAFDGSLGLNGVLYPLLYKVAFPFRSIRVPARFGMLVMLSVAALAGFGAVRLIARAPGAMARRALMAVFTAGLMIDGWPRYDMLPMWTEPPRIYRPLPASAVLFEFPVHPEPERFGENLPYMYFSMWHWRPMVNGYSGFNPREYAVTLERTRDFPAAPALEYLRQSGVTHIGVHCRLWESDVCAATTAQLGADPRVRLVTRADWYGAPSSLYEIR